MRTLKKTLCLVLVLAMMVGLGAFAAFAEDFTDADQIQNTEAVTVLTGMGVIKGNADGSFNPTGTLTRAEAACILVRALGMDDIKATSSFTDIDGVKSWAGDAIAVCEAEGIVLGVGDGMFDPQGKLTGSAWGKMLLKAIGYEDPDLDDAQKWEIAVAKGVKAAGLKEGLDSFDGTEAISRDDACQMAFNGIQYSATGVTNAYVVFNDANANGSVDGGETVYYQGTDAITALLMQNSNAGATLALQQVSEGSLGDENFDLTKNIAQDEFGRKSTEYSNGKTGSAKEVYGSFPAEAVKTYTTATTLGKIASELGATATTTKTITVITNGTAAAAAAVNKANATAIGAQGTLIEVYKNADGSFDVVVVDTYVKKLAAADINAAVAATATTDAVPANIVLEPTTATFVGTFDTTSFKAGDVVLYTKTAAGIVNVVKAEAVTGTISATAASYFRIDGEQVKLAAHAAVTNAVGTNNVAVTNADIGTAAANLDASATQERTFYKDSYGNVIYVENGATAAVDTKYVYVIQDAAKAAGSTGASDLFGTGATETAAQAQAKILDLETGEVKIVDLALVKATSGATEFATPAGAASGTPVATAAVGNNNFVAGIHRYAMVDGKYAITLGAAETDTPITQTTAKKATTNLGNMTAKTELTVVTYTTTSGVISGATVAKTTGYASMDFTAGYTTNVIARIDTAGYVTSILAVVPKAAAVTPVNYAFYKGAGETTASGDSYFEFYVGGEVKSYVDNANNGGAGWATSTLYDLTVNASAKTVTGTAVTGGISGPVAALQPEYVVVGTTTYYFADKYQVINATTDFSVGTLAVGDAVTLYLDTSGNVAFVTK